MESADIQIPRKKGPFFLRKLKLAELFDFFERNKVDGGAEHQALRRLVQMTLCTKDRKPVYSAQQLDRLEEDLGAVTVLTLANQAKRLNDFDKLTGLADQVEAAEKN